MPSVDEKEEGVPDLAANVAAMGVAVDVLEKGVQPLADRLNEGSDDEARGVLHSLRGSLNDRVVRVVDGALGVDGEREKARVAAEHAQEVGAGRKAFINRFLVAGTNERNFVVLNEEESRRFRSLFRIMLIYSRPDDPSYSGAGAFYSSADSLNYMGEEALRALNWPPVGVEAGEGKVWAWVRFSDGLEVCGSIRIDGEVEGDVTFREACHCGEGGCVSAVGGDDESALGDGVREVARKRGGHLPLDVRPPVVERVSGERVGFESAARILKKRLETEAEFLYYEECLRDLEKARDEAVKAHVRWGLVDALIRAGTVKDVDEYGALFDQATFSLTDLREVRRRTERGEKILPVFDAGQMPLDELFEVLFVESGIPWNHVRGDGSFCDLSKLRRIDPLSIPDLQGLYKESFGEQMKVLRAAYERAKPLKPIGPRVLFTPDECEVTHVGTSAIRDMQAFAEGGIKFIDPAADFIRFRTQVDAGLRKIFNIRRGASLSESFLRAFNVWRQKGFDDLSVSACRRFSGKSFRSGVRDVPMPDRRRTTYYPFYLSEHGGVAGLRLLDGCHVDKLSFNPLEGDGDPSVGARVVFG